MNWNFQFERNAIIIQYISNCWIRTKNIPKINKQIECFVCAMKFCHTIFVCFIRCDAMPYNIPSFYFYTWINDNDNDFCFHFLLFSFSFDVLDLIRKRIIMYVGKVIIQCFAYLLYVNDFAKISSADLSLVHLFRWVWDWKKKIHI